MLSLCFSFVNRGLWFHYYLCTQLISRSKHITRLFKTQFMTVGTCIIYCITLTLPSFPLSLFLPSLSLPTSLPPYLSFYYSCSLSISSHPSYPPSLFQVLMLIVWQWTLPQNKWKVWERRNQHWLMLLVSDIYMYMCMYTCTHVHPCIFLCIC